jgi:hypothetical protein
MSVAPLTSVTTFREQIRIPAEQAPDAAIEFKIAAYSKAICAYTQREFGKHPDENLARTFPYYGRGYFSLAPYDLRSVDSILVDTGPGGSPVTLTTSDWYGTGFGADGTYWSVVLPRRTLTRPVLVTITGAWGTEEVPEDVEAACVMAVGDAVRNPEGFAARAIGELSYTEVDEPPEQAGRNLPADARALLSPYVRVTYN